MSTTCTCCRGRRCVRVRSAEEIAFDAALLGLREKLAGEPPQAWLGKAVPQHPRPWEMTRRQFEAAAAPSFEPSWATRGRRFVGLSQSVLRREIHFLLRCPGGPVDGYRVRVPAARTDLHDQPHRAFVEAALAEGLRVPHDALSDYPDLGSGVWQQPAPRLT
jgi:hypothetical protein